MSASALRTNVPIISVSFPGVNPTTDSILSVDGAQYGTPGVGIPISTLLSGNSWFWLQADSNGVIQLCTMKTFNTKMIMHFTTPGGMGPLMKEAYNFIPTYFDQSGLPVWMPTIQ